MRSGLLVLHLALSIGLLAPPAESRGSHPGDRLASNTENRRKVLSQLAAGNHESDSSENKAAQSIHQTVHSQGNIQITVSNVGSYAWSFGPKLPANDPLTGERVYYCTYPRNSGLIFAINAALEFGALRNRDTLTCLMDFIPDPSANGQFTYASIDRSSKYYDQSAKSLLDVQCTFLDTSRLDRQGSPIDLDVKVSQNSYAWSGAATDDFILIECEVENLASSSLEELCVGINGINAVLPDELLDVGGEALYVESCLVGFLDHAPVGGRMCLQADRLNLAYIMSSDGRPGNHRWTTSSPLGAVGIRFLNGPEDSSISFNWHASSPPGLWGPRRRGTPDDPFRPFQIPSLPGSTVGEHFYLLRHYEVDYDQMHCAVDQSLSGWLSPPSDAAIIATGCWAEFRLVRPPISLPPGGRTTFVFAIIGADSIHVNPDDFERYWDPQYPYWYYRTLDFSRLAENARWAGWVYDNPGVDTDGDGYFGDFTLCDGDTLWYKGDGVPDWKADVPPPAPLAKIIPSQGKLTVRWNGYYSQTTPDPFTRIKDFEGYRVYMGRDSRLSSLGLLTSWDAENYQQFMLIQLQNGKWEWKAVSLPVSLDSLRSRYNDPDFEPLLYTRDHPLVVNDTFYRFEAQDYNQSSLTRPDGIRKVYPEEVLPPDDTTLWTDDMLTVEHGQPLPKYYEYEYTITDLLPTVEYQVVVTAFDFGFAQGGLPAQESSKLNNQIAAYALPSTDEVTVDKLTVYVWPNPYRYDGNYAEQGYENHDQSLWYDRARRIHFGNLPNKCTISILSLDGDLVKEIHHDYLANDPEASHDYWDLITRNTQLAVSGIYYWVVESATGNQMGKIVVIE